MNALELRERGLVPRVHGNGFIQVDLNKEGTKRLHVWDEDVPRQKVATPIHDHVFHMTSEVIVGTLIHEALLTHSDSFHGTHKVYRARREEGTQNTTLERVPGIVRLSTRERLILAEGSVYYFEAGKLHQTNHRGTTATIMEKIDAPAGYGTPRVLVPLYQEPDNDFRRDEHDVRLLWQIIERAIG